MGLTFTHPQLISWQEVKEKGYVVAHDKVYNVDNYISHPGGIMSLQRAKGTDSSKDYKLHTKDGKNTWKRFYIGKISTKS